MNAKNLRPRLALELGENAHDLNELVLVDRVNAVLKIVSIYKRRNRRWLSMPRLNEHKRG
jgi:hypothetical protein